jgi:hypothetical protein
MMNRYNRAVKAFLILVVVTSLVLLAGPGRANAAAAVIVSPSSGTPYSLVTLIGSGFISLDTIPANGITFAAVPWNTGVIQIDSYGNWNISLRVPANAVAGTNTVRVATTGGTVVTKTFTVTKPPMTVWPGSGPPYTLVSITGSSFAPLDSIPVGGIKFDGAPWNTAEVPVDGSGQWATSLRVPVTAACCGSKPITVTTAAGTVSSATFNIVAAVVTLTPSSGPIGTKVTVCVTNMTADGTVPTGGIIFGGLPWNSSPFSIDGTGSICSTFLTVPNMPAAAYAVVVNDGHLQATSAFTITQPTISVSSATGYKGDTVTVTGSGWPQHTPSSVSITFGGSVVTTATPNANGDISVQFTVPLTAYATNPVGAYDILGNTALSKTFSLKAPTLTLNPTNGSSGTSVAVSGVGFQSYSDVELKFGNVNVNPGGLLTNEVGTFSATFIVPGLPPGWYSVAASVFGVSISTYFTLNESNVTPSPVEPTLPIEDALASISDKVIIGWGYTPQTGWQMYDPNDALGSTLSGLTSGRGYWIKVTDDCTLGIRNLTKGWNLIGW